MILNTFFIAAAAFSTSLAYAADLSGYREFQFGMNLQAVVKQAGMKLADARLVHERPEVIQELEWQPRRFIGSNGQLDSVDSIVFSFYGGNLFRMLIAYDRHKTEGLTADDMIEAISAQYGTAARDAAPIDFPSAYNKKVTVLARWEDTEHSFNLIHSFYQPGFALVALSKRLDALAGTAVVEAIRLDEQEAPQREVARLKKQEEDSRDQQDKARLANKPGFRP